MNPFIFSKLNKLSNMYRDDEEMMHFLKALWIHNDPENKPEDPHKMVVPGNLDLQKADKILSTLGYSRYSIDYLPRKAYGYDTTQVTFRNM